MTLTKFLINYGLYNFSRQNSIKTKWFVRRINQNHLKKIKYNVQSSMALIITNKITLNMSREKIEKILVPFDGSKFSERAAKNAINIAKKFDAKISFITVVPSGSNPPPSKILGILTDDKKVQKGFHQTICAARMDLKKSLTKIVESCKNENISAEYKILEGNTIEKIIQFSKKGKYDLIVMGSHGLTGLTKIQALGSIARAISEIAPCPVLLVRERN